MYKDIPLLAQFALVNMNPVREDRIAAVSGSFLSGRVQDTVVEHSTTT